MTGNYFRELIRLTVGFIRPTTSLDEALECLSPVLADTDLHPRHVHQELRELKIDTDIAIVLLANCVDVPYFTEKESLIPDEKVAVRTAFRLLDRSTQRDLERASHNGVPLPRVQRDEMLAAASLAIDTLYEEKLFSLSNNILLRYPNAENYDPEALSPEALSIDTRVWFFDRFKNLYPICYRESIDRFLDQLVMKRLARDSHADAWTRHLMRLRI